MHAPATVPPPSPPPPPPTPPPPGRCVPLKAQLLASLGLGLFAPCRLALDPYTSGAASALYAAAAAALFLVHAACTLACSVAAAGTPAAVSGRWEEIGPLLARSGVWGRLVLGCTGEAAPLYRAAALLGLGSVAALSGGATLLLGLVLVLARHERAHEAAHETAHETAEGAAAEGAAAAPSSPVASTPVASAASEGSAVSGGWWHWGQVTKQAQRDGLREALTTPVAPSTPVASTTPLARRWSRSPSTPAVSRTLSFQPLRAAAAGVATGLYAATGFCAGASASAPNTPGHLRPPENGGRGPGGGRDRRGPIAASIAAASIAAAARLAPHSAGTSTREEEERGGEGGSQSPSSTESDLWRGSMATGSMCPGTSDRVSHASVGSNMETSTGGDGRMGATSMQHVVTLTPRTTQRTTQLDSPGWGDATLVLEHLRGCELPPKVARPVALITALVMLAAAWVAAMLFWDATAASAMPYTLITIPALPPALPPAAAGYGAASAPAAASAADEAELELPHARWWLPTVAATGGVGGGGGGGTARRHRVMASAPYAVAVNCTGAVIRLHNGWARGVTTVVLLGSEGSNASIDLEVDSAAPLATPPALSVSWDGFGAACGAAEGGGAAAPTLNISAFAPAGCDEQCPWRWLWAGCRCHAIARLTVTLPRMPGAPPLAEALGAPAALPSLHASAREGSVRVVGGGLGAERGDGLGAGQPLRELDVRATAGDALVQGVGAAGLVRVRSPAGQAVVREVLAAQLDVGAASAMVEGVLAARPCFCSGGRPTGAGCAALGLAPPPPPPPPPPGTPWAWLPPPPAAAAAAAEHFCPNRTALVMGTVRLAADGGPVVLNGTLASATVDVVVGGGGTLAVSDAQILGRLRMTHGLEEGGGSGGGGAYLSNVLALGCDICMQPRLVSGLAWNASAAPELLCVCDDAPAPAIHFEAGGTASLDGALLLTRALNASTYAGAISLVEIVLLPHLDPERMLQPAVDGGEDPSAAEARCEAEAEAPASAPPPPGYARALPPRLEATSTLGGVTLLGLIALQPAEAAAVQCRLASVGGDVKATFSGGAINGSYAVSQEQPAIGRVGIVIDDAPTAQRAGRLGSGNASVQVEHSYGSLALSLSSKAPSAFAGVLAGSGGAAAALVGGGRPAPRRHQVSLHRMLGPAAPLFL